MSNREDNKIKIKKMNYRDKIDKIKKTDNRAETDNRTETDNRSETDNRVETDNRAETDNRTETGNRAETGNRVETDNRKETYKRINLKNPFHETLVFGIFLAIVGGFLDAYTYVGRDGVFANAQTGNIVLVGVFAAQGNIRQALLHIPPILAFVIGVLVTESMKQKVSLFFIRDWKRAVLLLEIIVLFIVGFIPYSVPDIIVNVTISFVTSVQVSSFRKLVNTPYATTMCTGNLRTASEAAYLAFTKKDRTSALIALRLFSVIFAFVIGAFLGGIFTLALGVKAIWSAVILLIIVLILFVKSEENIPVVK